MDHDKCREKVCVVCIRKASRNLSEKDIELVKIYVCGEYEVTDPDFPCGLCNGRYLLLRKKSLSSETVLPITQFKPDRSRLLRSSDKCHCTICDVAKSNINKPKKLKKKKGRPKKDESKMEKKSNSIKVCKVCFTEIYQGCRHQCSQYRYREKKLNHI